MSYSPTAYILL